MSFDEYATEYDAALEQGIAVSGEAKEYFARNRVAWLSSCLRELGQQPRQVMDYGCGTGTAEPFILDLLPEASVVGVDVSRKSLQRAREVIKSDRARFLSFEEFVPNAELDLSFCNGVFHHIPPKERANAVNYIYRSLRRNGLFALWENNPWNPGTRYVMWRIPFDRDAIPIAAPEARRMLRNAGFQILRTDFLFIFPHMLRSLRALEAPLSRLPLGAQYQVLCRKP